MGQQASHEMHQCQRTEPGVRREVAVNMAPDILPAVEPTLPAWRKNPPADKQRGWGLQKRGPLSGEANPLNLVTASPEFCMFRGEP